MKYVGTEGKRRTFEHVTLTYFNSLYNTAHWMTQDAAEAEDLIQETYLKAYQSFHLFTLWTDCKSWLFQILRNTFINTYHKKKRETSNTISQKNTECVPSQHGEREKNFSMAPPIPGVSKRLIIEDITQALENLPDCYRVVIRLAYLEGFSYQEIAHRMDCPVRTVMTWSYRGRKRLQKLLADYGN